MGGRGASASFDGISAKSYVSTFDKALNLSNEDITFLKKNIRNGATHTIDNFKTLNGNVKTTIKIDNGKLIYEIKEKNKILLTTRNKKQAVNKLANRYIQANREVFKKEQNKRTK